MNCKNCGAPVNPELKKCTYCDTYYDPQLVSVWNLLNDRKFRKTKLYPFSIVFGVIIVGVIYTFLFDQLSETLLIQLTPAWYFAIVFGLYGYTAEKIISLVILNKASDFQSAFHFWEKNIMKRNILLGLFVKLFFFPFPFFNKMNPLPVAFSGAAIWGLFLSLFFHIIFPLL